jgi:para-nitrobenzyl esterase
MRRLVFVSAILCIAGAFLAPIEAGADAVGGTVVHTVAGDVGGIVDGVAVEWRGVPYAAPPVGDRRWRMPSQPLPWAGVRPATQFAPECVQLGSEAPVEGSEDCLYLNVFAPVGTSPSARLPVMVHLHGGSNFFFHAYRNADALVQRGVIVVTVGYRLGVMGFAGHPQLTAEGNGSSGEYGVLDQIAALHWVQDNIAGFGGNPSNVTLFGESAGSFDAVAIAASPLGRGLFARLAAQTEAFWPLNGTGTIADAEDIGSQVSTAVGCSTSPDVVACLRSVPAETLVEAAGPNDVAPWVGGRVLPKPPLELITSQNSPVPMLVGSNREEAAFWFAGGGVLPPGDEYLPQDRYRDTNGLVGPQNGSELRKLYPTGAYGSAFWASIAAYSDAVYTCPIRRLALASRGPVYRYLYTHVYDTVPDPVIIAARAAHFFDEPILWHDPALFSGLDFAFSVDEERLSARMTDYWTNFAKRGNPNAPGLESWPPFTARAENIKVLDEPGGNLVGYHHDECTFLDQIPYLQALAKEYTPQSLRPRSRAPRNRWLPFPASGQTWSR